MVVTCWQLLFKDQNITDVIYVVEYNVRFLDLAFNTELISDINPEILF